MRKVGVILPVFCVLMAREIQVSHLGRRRFGGSAYERQTSGAQRITGNIRLGDEQAGARILLKVLGVHRHAADEKDGPAETVSRIGHHGAEGKSRKFSRM